MAKICEQVGAYLEYCEKVRGMTEATMRAKANVLERFGRATGLEKIEDLTNEAFNGWVEHEVARGVSARSINIYNATVVAMVRYYREFGLVVPLNLTLVKKLKERRIQRKFYTEKEIRQVSILSDEETALMINIMFETGMRIAELTRLKLADFNGRQIRFIGKGQKSREVYIKEETLVLVRKYVLKHGTYGYLWGRESLEAGGNGEPPTVNTVRNRLRTAFLRAGFEGFYPHALRHSFATHLQKSGAEVAEIKEMMGHESIATTERYLHGFEGRLEELFLKYQ